MEILFVVALGAIVVYLGYRALNRESSDGRHPLDAVTEKNAAPYKVEPPVVDNKTGEPVVVQAEQKPAWHTAPAEDTKPVTVESVVTQALDVNHDGKVNFDDVKEAVKKVRKPRTPKTEVKVAKQEVKKAAKPKKPAAMKAKTVKSKKI